MNKKYYLFFIAGIFIISLISAQGLISPETPSNGSTLNVNNSQFLNGFASSYFYPASNPSGFITSTQGNDTYIKKTAVNTTQINSGDDLTIKESWLTTFINSLGFAKYQYTTNIFNGSGGFNLISDETKSIKLENPLVPNSIDLENYASPYINFISQGWDAFDEEVKTNNFKIYSKGAVNVYDGINPSLVIENAETGKVNTRFVDTGYNVKATDELVVHSGYASNSVWLDLPVGEFSQTGIGFGGYGANPFFAYCGASGYWAAGSAYQDVAYRNTEGRMLFVNDPNYNAVLIIDKAPSRTIQANTPDFNVFNAYGTMGAEKISNPYFATDTTSWTLGAAWRWVDATDNVQKYQDGTNTLTQTSAAMVTPLVVGRSYKLSYKISTVSGGGVTPTIGGATLPYRKTAGTFYESFTATTTGTLTFTPDNTARFFIDDITLWEIQEGDITSAGTVYTRNLDITNNTYTGNITPQTTNTASIGTSALRYLKGWFSGLDVNGTTITTNLNVTNNTYINMPYAMFSDNTTQVIGVANTAQVINFSTVEDMHNINIEGKKNITVKVSGDYYIDVSAIYSVDTPNKQVEFWVQKTNSTGQFINVARSNTKMGLSTASLEIPLAVSFIIDLLPTEKIRFMAASDDAGSSLVYTTNTSYSPETPSIIVNIHKISEITP